MHNPSALDDTAAFIASLQAKARLVEEKRRRDGEKKPKKKIAHRPEQDLQETCVSHFDSHYPTLAPLLHHSPNEGKRTAFAGAHLRAMGMRKGFPDLVLLLPSGQYTFLAMEFKAKHGVISDEQYDYADVIPRFGGKFLFIKSFNQFKEEIEKYVPPIYERQFHNPLG